MTKINVNLQRIDKLNSTVLIEGIAAVMTPATRLSSIERLRYTEEQEAIERGQIAVRLIARGIRI